MQFVLSVHVTSITLSLLLIAYLNVPSRKTITLLKYLNTIFLET